MTLQIIYTSKCPGNQNSISQSFTLLKESEANMDCSEEPLETNTAHEFEIITIKKEIVDPEESI